MNRTAEEFIEAIARNTEGLEAVSTGICPGCSQCLDEYGKPVPCECKGEEPDCPKCDGRGERQPTPDEFEDQWSTGEVFAEPFFSWHRCDLCGSTLGGDREPWHAVDKASGKIIHGERACVDCMIFLANGQLPGEGY